MNSWTMNWRGSRRNTSWPSGGIIQTFSWRYWWDTKHVRTAGIPVEIRAENFSYRSLYGYRYSHLLDVSQALCPRNTEQIDTVHITSSNKHRKIDPHVWRNFTIAHCIRISISAVWRYSAVAAAEQLGTTQTARLAFGCLAEALSSVLPGKC